MAEAEDLFSIKNTKDLPKRVGEGLTEKDSEVKCLQINAMRPEFRLGSLYDRISDNLLPGFTLWKEDSLRNKNYVNQRTASNQSSIIDAENSFSSKFRHMDIEASLSLSIMGGIVDISGHANYLKDEQQSSDVAKVSLTYTETTEFRELTSEALHNIDYGNLLKDDLRKKQFTHIVVGILYGGSCTMVFEKDVQKCETKENVEGSLSLAIKSLKIDGKGNLKYDSKNIMNSENIKCSIYSDIKVDTNISTWDEAMELYKSLPKLLKAHADSDEKKGVPTRIWLLPKQLLGSPHDTMVRELSQSAASQLSEILESLIKAINTSNDMQRDLIFFPTLQNKVEKFGKVVRNYKTTFQKETLSTLLQIIRSGTGEESMLYTSLEHHNNSPFSQILLSSWLKKLQIEANFLLGLQDLLSENGFEFVDSRIFERKIMQKKVSVVFTIKVCKNEDMYLDSMEAFYKHRAKVGKQPSLNEASSKKKWYNDEQLKNKMREMAFQIGNFSSANTKNEKVSFLVKESEAENNVECCIEVWECGRKFKEGYFEFPTKIRDLTAGNICHNSVEIYWKAPAFGRKNISCFNVKVKKINTDNKDVNNNMKIKEFEVKYAQNENMSLKIDGLECGNLYVVSIHSLCLNKYARTETETLNVKTRPSNPPIDFAATVIHARRVKLKWQPPNYISPNIVFDGYMIYKKIEELNWSVKTLAKEEESYMFKELCFFLY